MIPWRLGCRQSSRFLDDLSEFGIFESSHIDQMHDIADRQSRSLLQLFLPTFLLQHCFFWPDGLGFAQFQIFGNRTGELCREMKKGGAGT